MFEHRYIATTGTLRMYDVTRDGQEFVMVKDSEQAAPVTQINVVQNWPEELKARAPAR